VNARILLDGGAARRKGDIVKDAAACNCLCQRCCALDEIENRNATTLSVFCKKSYV
jgi:hypothetical protein